MKNLQLNQLHFDLVCFIHEVVNELQEIASDIVTVNRTPNLAWAVTGDSLHL